MKTALRERIWRIESRKFDGAPHRIWTRCCPVRPDVWYKGALAPDFVLHIPPGGQVKEADGRVWASVYDVFSCFYRARHFQVTVLLKPSGVEYYCNVCTIPRVDRMRRRVLFADLELDVLVGDRSVRVVDHDEFTQNTLRYGYSALLRERVFADLRLLTQQARMRRGAFSPAFVRSVRRSLQKARYLRHSCVARSVESR